MIPDSPVLPQILQRAPYICATFHMQRCYRWNFAWIEQDRIWNGNTAF